LDRYFELSTQLGSLFFVPLALLPFVRWGNIVKHFSRQFLLWIPAVSGLGLYSLVLVEPRYVVPFVFLLWASVYSCLRIPRSRLGKVIARSTALVVVCLLGFEAVWAVGHATVRITKHDFPARTVANALQNAGIHPGDRVASVGNAIGDHAWAHLAGVTIVAEVPADGAPTFLASAPEGRARVLDVLARTGAKAVVGENLPSSLTEDGWRQIPNTNYSAFIYAGQSANHARP
jgi:hypothetical protein